jgi:hypothetical protein
LAIIFQARLIYQMRERICGKRTAFGIGNAYARRRLGFTWR